MASGPITSWQIDGEKMEIMADFIFLSSKITVDGDCSHKIKRHLLLGRKGMTNLDSVLKSIEELKSFLMNVKEKSEKAGLKLNIQKTKIMESGPITLWQIDGKQWKQWQTLFSLAPKSLQMVIAAMKWKHACSLEERLWPT